MSDEKVSGPSGFVLTAAVAAGVLIAVAVVWAVVQGMSGQSEYDCTMDNADRALAGEPAKDC
jgi:hypothetical protein